MERLKSKSFILFAAAAVVLAGAAAAVEFARSAEAVNPRLERLLPADTIGFVEVNDLRAQALKVIESEAWREFSKENSSASSLFMIGANHAGVLDASYAVALLGVGAGEAGRPEPQFVIVAQFSDSDARRTFEYRVLRFVRDGMSKGVEVKMEELGDARVNTVKRLGVHRFTYAQSGNLLVVSNADAAVRRVLEVRAGAAPSLETNEKFKQARAGSGAVDGMFGFLDGAALTALVDAAPAAVSPEAGERVAAFRQLFHGVGAASVQSASFTSSFEDGRVAERFRLVAPNREGVLATVAANPPTEGRLLALVPEDAAQAFDASVANAPQTFDQMLALATQLTSRPGQKGPVDALAEFAEKTGVDFRSEIVGALGAEFCAAQLPAADGGHDGVVLLNLRDEQAFARTLAKFAEANKRETSEREYKGVTVRRIAGEKGRGLEYAFVGGALVASGGAGAVERVIDTAQGGRSLKSSAAYQSASARLQSPPQFVYFSSNADYLNRLGRTLSGGAQEFKTEGQRAGLRPSFAFGVTREDGFYVESRTPLGTFPRMLTAVSSRLGQQEEKKGAGAE